MRSVTLCHSNITVSEFSFGTGSLHHFSSIRKQINHLATAVGCGFSHFDTAPLYGFSSAETALGRSRVLCMDGVTVATKVGLYPPSLSSTNFYANSLLKAAGRAWPRLSRANSDWSVKRAEGSLHESLKRLRREYLDILWLHEPSFELMQTDEWSYFMDKLLTSGKVRAFGLAGERHKVFPARQITDHGDFLIQTRFSPSLGEGNSHTTEEKVHFGYGYFTKVDREDDSVKAMRKVLKNKQSDVVLVSTRRAERLEQYARVSETLQCS